MVRRVAFWVALVVWGASDGVQAFNIEERERALAEAKKAQAEREQRARQAEPPQQKPTPRPVENKKPPRRTSVQPVVSETESSRGERECVHGVCFDMVAIPSGSFQMGSPDTEPGRFADEGPVHTVNVKGFWLGKTEVTQGLWKAVMGSNPSYFKDCGDNCPVEQVSWNDAQEFIKKLNGLTGKKYRLPSESEWEYGARAGTRTRYWWGDDVGNTQQCQYANGADKTAKAKLTEASNWTISNCEDGYANTAPVGNYKANPWGLYDMNGNVWEWVQDTYVNNYNGAPTDGSAREENSVVARVLRGGSWINFPQDLRSAIRIGNTPDYRSILWGLRLARTN